MNDGVSVRKADQSEGGRMPLRSAYLISSALPCSLSFVIRFSRCVSTVLGLIERSDPIMRLLFPSAVSLSTVSSRSVSVS